MTYTIPAHTRLWRTALPLTIWAASLDFNAGGTAQHWDKTYSTRAVTYTEDDLLDPQRYNPILDEYFYFRLPAAAYPYTVIEVRREFVNRESHDHLHDS